MQQFHSLCPICDQSKYIQTINNIDFADSNLSFSFLEYVLNPIIYVSKFTNEDEKFMMKHQGISNLQFHHYDFYNQAFPVEMDALYGFDFFIQGCQYLMQNQQQMANEHFQMFDKINQFTHTIFKRQIPEYYRFHNKYFNDVCEEVLNIIKSCYPKLETIDNPNVKSFMLRNCQSILQGIENLQFPAQTIYENSFQLLLERKKKLHRCQVQLAYLSRTITEDAILTRTYQTYLQDTTHINQIGAILFTGLINTEKLWEIYFVRLNGEQRLSHISSLIFFLNKQYDDSYIICLLKLGKQLKRFKEYWLSLVIYSFFRKVSIVFQKQFNFNCYLPYLYYQIAKICLYLGQFNEAYQLYLKAYEKSKQLNYKNLYIEIKDSRQFCYKIKYKIMILSLYLQKSVKAIEMVKELLSDGNSMPYHINIFTNYCNQYLQDAKQFNETLKYRKCELFLKHLSKVIKSNLNNIQIPQDDIKQLANVIELKDKDIPKTNLKQKIEFEFKLNSYFSLLQFYLILVCHMRNDQMTTKHYYEKQQIMDQFLQYIDCRLYTTLQNVIEQFQFSQDCIENLLLSYVYQYFSMQELCINRLVQFEKSKQENKKKYSDQESQLFKKIVDNFRSFIRCNREEPFQEQCLPSSDYAELQYSIGIRYLKDGRYREGVEYLKRASCNPAFKDLCTAHLLKVVQQSREDLEIGNSNLRENIGDIFKQIDFDRLQSSQSRRTSYCMEYQRQSFQAESRRSMNYLVESQALSQISRSNSLVQDSIYYTLWQLKYFLMDQEITDLIDRIEEEFPNVQQLNQQSFQNKYPNYKEITPDVTFFSNDNEKIVMKTKQITEMQFEKIKSKLKDFLIEILAQVLVNKCNYRGFAQLISLQYQINICQSYASSLKFYLIFPYYEPMVKMDIQQLRDLTLSIQILNQNKIIHRDLKPNNILMKNGNPVIIDFDCSYYWEPNLQQWLRGKGLTTKYYPANDIEQDKIDIYSLGIIAKESVENCPEAFYTGATQEYSSRSSLLQLQEILN
ncbi:unnamed protein product [Paramecium octaurelia]|uniref:Protein kinase domain-containing protein n=1 Tax=Paramecium octaurelia TaxID=43137 RepID=A0A8S1TYE8_PAROT|nr:unnamed protein product [Paramecium octaurelia]